MLTLYSEWLRITHDSLGKEFGVRLTNARIDGIVRLTDRNESEVVYIEYDLPQNRILIADQLRFGSGETLKFCLRLMI